MKRPSWTQYLVATMAAVLLASAGPALAADNFNVKDAAAATKTKRAKDVGAGVLSDVNILSNAAGDTLIDPATAQKQDTGNASLSSIDTKIVAPTAGTATTTITRPADTTAYLTNEAIADSTSSPTTGGFTLANVCRTNSGSGILTGAAIISSNDPTTLLQGEVWIFDSALTAVNDNATFSISDADALKLVGVVPFALASTAGGSGTNSYYATGGLSLAYTCSGSQNLRFLVKTKNGYTPASGETVTVRFNFVATN